MKLSEAIAESLLSEWSPAVGNRWEYIFPDEGAAQHFAQQVKASGVVRGAVKVAPTNGWKTWSVSFPKLTQMRDMVDFNTKVKYAPAQAHYADIIADLKDKAR